ncbi:hypothetical protein D3C85_812970 [compost metagenome]
MLPIWPLMALTSPITLPVCCSLPANWWVVVMLPAITLRPICEAFSTSCTRSRVWLAAWATSRTEASIWVMAAATEAVS